MTRPAEFRCDVPTAELLALLSGEPLPLGLVTQGIARHRFRDLYLDTAEGALSMRGVVCRVRYGADDRRTLTLAVSEPGIAGAAPDQVFEAAAQAVELPAILSADSDPARRLRAFVDPVRLEPRVELEIERLARSASRRWGLPGRFALLYDRVTVRNGPLVREFHELKVRRLFPGRPRLEELGRAFEQAHGLRPRLQTKLLQARTLLRQMGRESLIRDLDSGRAVAVIAIEEGRVALVRGAGGLRLPVSQGSGEQAVRYALGEWFGSRVGDVTLLGRTPPSLEQPSVEAWLVRRLRRDSAPADGPTLEWITPSDLARVARGPELRDPVTRAVLTVAARSTLIPEWETPAEPHEVPTTDPLPAAPEAGDLLDARQSLLEFNSRVLAVAEDERTPLLERFRYLAIVSGNLDELYMSAGARVPARQAEELLARQQRCIAECLARLEERGYRMRRWADLQEDQREALRRRFREEFFPILTPRAITISPGHPFPSIPPLTLSLAVAIQELETGPLHFAYLRLPGALPRFVELAGGDLVPIEEIVSANLAVLYPDRAVEASALFRVTRRGELELEETRAGDLLQAVEEELGQRALGPVVRLEVQHGTSSTLRGMLIRELRFETGHRESEPGGLVIHEVEGFVAPGDLRQLTGLPLAGGLFPPFAGADPLPRDRSIWSRLRERDVLLHHPYDDFSATVLRLFEQAADDPAVAAIKLTLYRAGESSPGVEALIRAAEAGKEVAVFVELKASYDEARNIAWVKRLERAGAQVVYGLVGFKNHAKVALVVRREEGGVRRYVHVGTGNYNAATAKAYTDLGLLSADPALGEDLADLFNQLTGTSAAPGAALRRLLVAPEHLLPALLERIGREAELARSGRPGRIRAKLNGIDDPEIIRALYAASQAGVEVDLVVRGLCTLMPGVPGRSERIRVRGLVGRFLEHARIYHFGNDGEDEYLIGSADWRSRNLRRRVETVTPVLDEACRRRLDLILSREIGDPSGWELGPDGRYRQARNLAVGDPATAQSQAIAAAQDTPAREAAWTR
jgi:polyphosphate kinase